MYNKKPTYKKSSAKDKHTVAVVKSVLNRELETKSAMARITASSITEGLLYAANIGAAAVTQGSQAQQIVGEKMFLKNLHLKMNLISSSAAVPKTFRVMVVASKDKLTNSTNFSLQTNSSILRPDVLPGDLTLGHIDLHRVDVLYDHTFAFNPTLSASDAQRRDLTIRIPINKSVYAESENGSYFKNKNYYLAVTSYQSGALAVPVSLDAVLAVNFRDA